MECLWTHVIPFLCHEFSKERTVVTVRTIPRFAFAHHRLGKEFAPKITAQRDIIHVAKGAEKRCGRLTCSLCPLRKLSSHARCTTFIRKAPVKVLSWRKKRYMSTKRLSTNTCIPNQERFEALKNIKKTCFRVNCHYLHSTQQATAK